MREQDLPEGGDIGGLVAAATRLRALPLDADDGGDDGRLRVEVGPLPLDHHPLRPLRYRLRTLQGPTLVLGVSAACRETFCVFTLRTCFTTRPAGRASYCRGKGRYS